MAKRARGATSRPGQRRAIQRTAARPPAPTAKPSTGAGPTWSAVAPADVDAVVPATTVAPATKTVARSRTRPGVVASDAFVAEEAAEYRYVVADVRRIVVVAAGMFGIMAVLFVLIDLTGAVHL